MNEQRFFGFDKEKSIMIGRRPFSIIYCSIPFPFPLTTKTHYREIISKYSHSTVQYRQYGKPIQTFTTFFLEQKTPREKKHHTAFSVPEDVTGIVDTSFMTRTGKYKQQHVQFITTIHVK